MMQCQTIYRTSSCAQMLNDGILALAGLWSSDHWTNSLILRMQPSALVILLPRTLADYSLHYTAPCLHSMSRNMDARLGSDRSSWSVQKRTMKRSGSSTTKSTKSNLM